MTLRKGALSGRAESALSSPERTVNRVLLTMTVLLHNPCPRVQVSWPSLARGTLGARTALHVMFPLQPFELPRLDRYRRPVKHPPNLAQTGGRPPERSQRVTPRFGPRGDTRQSTRTRRVSADSCLADTKSLAAPILVPTSASSSKPRTVPIKSAGAFSFSRSTAMTTSACNAELFGTPRIAPATASARPASLASPAAVSNLNETSPSARRRRAASAQDGSPATSSSVIRSTALARSRSRASRTMRATAGPSSIIGGSISTRRTTVAARVDRRPPSSDSRSTAHAAARLPPCLRNAHAAAARTAGIPD